MREKEMGVSWITGLLLLTSDPGMLGNASCAESCYERKSEAYQQCRGIPPKKRGKRNRCFQSADAALKRCLARCG